MGEFPNTDRVPTSYPSDQGFFRGEYGADERLQALRLTDCRTDPCLGYKHYEFRVRQISPDVAIVEQVATSSPLEPLTGSEALPQPERNVHPAEESFVVRVEDYSRAEF